MELRTKTVFLLAAFLTLTGNAFAQKVAFELEAPGVVAKGEVFRVEFISDSKPRNFTGPDFGGMEVLAGPSLYTSSNVTVVNGSMEQSSRYTYTYVLQAHDAGEFTITEAFIEVGRDTYHTKPHKVVVIDESEGQQSPQPEGASARTQGSAAAKQQDAGKTAVAPDDMLLIATVNKSTVFKGEPVKVTYKLYSRLNMGGVESAKTPAFNGFWTQQLDAGGNGPQRETHNGKIYNTWVMSEYLLYPQMAGNLTVDPMELTAIAQIITRQQKRQSIMDDFFNMPDVQEVRRRLASQPIRIKVNELPAGAPASFNGAVGEFEMSSTLPPSEIAANSAVTYNVKISGNGNLPQIQAPKFQIPASFEQYNIKTTETLNNTPYGISGYRQFEYPIIARVVGEYDISPVEFSYFNPRLARYQTLRTPSLTLRVLPDSTSTKGSGAGMISGISKEDIKMLGRDIRFIKMGSPNLHTKGRVFMWSPSYFVSLIVLLAAFALLLLWLRKFMEERRNMALIKGKRANKVALLRFRAAEEHMNAGNQRGFYEEMLKALWGYMSDKLNIPSSNLTKENVREELVKKGIEPDLAERYVEIIGECEYAQYAPAASGRMTEAYKAGVEIVSKFESLLGR